MNASHLPRIRGRRILRRALQGAITASGVALAVIGAILMPMRLPLALAQAANPAQNGTGRQVIQDIQQMLDKGYDLTSIIVTYGPDGKPFVGIGGVKVPTADAGTQQVFFFSGTSYLGTDASSPRPGITVVDSPAAGQINVQYANYAPADPLCCPSRAPVTITYTWDGSTVSASGTPPTAPGG